MPRPAPKTTPQQLRARREYARVPVKTKADDPNRYTKTPHEYGDILVSGGKLGGPLQRDLLYWIERHTWGNPKRPEFAKLSLTQLSRLCQTWDADKDRLRPVERKSVAVALADLEKRGIIEARDRKGCGQTTAKMYKLTPERWKKAPVYIPPTIAEIETAEAEAETTEEDELEPATEPTTEQTVDPGKVSRPAAMSIRPARNAEPVTIRVVYSPSGFEHPVTFRTRAGSNGRLVISASPHRHSSNPPLNCSRTQPQFFASVSPSDSTVSVESIQVSSYTAWVTEFVLSFWGKAADQGLIESIISAAAGAPIAVFDRIARQKLTRDLAHGRRKYVPGILINLAQDAARSHQAAEQAAATQERARTAQAEADAAYWREIDREAHSGPKREKCPTCNGMGSVKGPWRSIGGEYGPHPIACEPCAGTGWLQAKAAAK